MTNCDNCGLPLEENTTDTLCSHCGEAALFTWKEETIEAYEDFFNQPGINKTGVCEEAGISVQLLNAILRGDKSLTDKTEKKLAPIIQKYSSTDNYANGLKKANYQLLIYCENQLNRLRSKSVEGNSPKQIYRDGQMKSFVALIEKLKQKIQKIDTYDQG